VGTHLRRDAALFLPMRGWLDSDKCRASEHAAALSRENIQYIVFCEDEFSKHSRGPNVLIGADTVLTQQEQFLLSTSSQAYMQIDTPSDNWLAGLVDDRYRAVTIEGAPRVRAYVHDAKDATYVHLLNLDVRKRSSFTDEIVAVTDLHVRVNLQLILRGMQPETRTLKLDSVELLTADDNTTRGALPFTMDESSGYLTLTIPILEVAAILAIKLG
jgi:hypothetical protein